MADSHITKQALAASLRELMRDVPFEKIKVANICEKCGMSRKSFYYHFKDKYDLVNWIFDTNFTAFSAANVSEGVEDDRWEFIEKACEHFYEERDFYRKAFLIKGQNSFSDHFREYIFPMIKKRLVCLVGDEEADDFTVGFFSDAILYSIERWILDKNCMSPVAFLTKIRGIVRNGAVAIYQETMRESDRL